MDLETIGMSKREFLKWWKLVERWYVAGYRECYWKYVNEYAPEHREHAVEHLLKWKKETHRAFLKRRRDILEDCRREEQQRTYDS